MRTYRKFFLALPLIIVLFCFVGCDLISQNSDAQDLIKTGSLTLDLATSTNLAKVSSAPVTGSEITLELALINIQNIELASDLDDDVDQDEENEQESDHQDNDDEDNDQAKDVEIPGPFVVDVSSGDVDITTTRVPTGTYCQAELNLGVSYAFELEGHSILLTGTFTSPIMGTFPLSLMSNFGGDVECAFVDGPLVVGDGAFTQITLLLDLVSALDSIDFGDADMSDGQIIINESINPDLLAIFEQQLSRDDNQNDDQDIDDDDENDANNGNDDEDDNDDGDDDGGSDGEDDD